MEKSRLLSTCEGIMEHLERFCVALLIATESGSFIIYVSLSTTGRQFMRLLQIVLGRNVGFMSPLNYFLNTLFSAALLVVALRCNSMANSDSAPLLHCWLLALYRYLLSIRGHHLQLLLSLSWLYFPV